MWALYAEDVTTSSMGRLATFTPPRGQKKGELFTFDRVLRCQPHPPIDFFVVRISLLLLLFFSFYAACQFTLFVVVIVIVVANLCVCVCVCVFFLSTYSVY